MWPKIRRLRRQISAESFLSFCLFCSIHPSSVAKSVSHDDVPLVRFALVYRSMLQGDENHKKLKAEGENNIIRNYSHSSAAHKGNKERLSQLSLDYRFFSLFLCAITLAPRNVVLSQVHAFYMDHVPVKSYPHTTSPSGFQLHEF